MQIAAAAEPIGARRAREREKDETDGQEDGKKKKKNSDTNNPQWLGCAFLFGIIDTQSIDLFLSLYPCDDDPPTSPGSGGGVYPYWPACHASAGVLLCCVTVDVWVRGKVH